LHSKKAAVPYMQGASQQRIVPMGVHKQRRQLWRKIVLIFWRKPAAFLTLVPLGRLVAFDQLASVNLENEKRAMRRVLLKALPKCMVLVSIFAISATDDTAGDDRLRY
jgi:hypothetical protein